MNLIVVTEARFRRDSKEGVYPDTVEGTSYLVMLAIPCGKPVRFWMFGLLMD